MGMAAILFIGAEPFEKIDDAPSKEDPMWNLMKSGWLVSEKTLKITGFYTCRQPRGKGKEPRGGFWS